MRCGVGFDKKSTCDAQADGSPDAQGVDTGIAFRPASKSRRRPSVFHAFCLGKAMWRILFRDVSPFWSYPLTQRVELHGSTFRPFRHSVRHRRKSAGIHGLLFHSCSVPGFATFIVAN